MNNRQTYRLEKAISLIEDALRLQNETPPKITSTWLRVAGNYCNEVAEELGKGASIKHKKNKVLVNN